MPSETITAAPAPTQLLATIERLDESVPAPPLPAETPGPFCLGSPSGFADICLMPQRGNARWFGVDVAAHPRPTASGAACMALPARADAVPDRHPDAA